MEKKDPLGGTKLTDVDASDPLQLATVAFRTADYVALVQRNDAGTKRTKKRVTDGVWREERGQVSCDRVQGAHWNVVGWNEQSVTWLHPEEALWLLDAGSLRLRHPDGREISRPWLWERLFGRQPIDGLSPGHYAAYQLLRSFGYPTRRWSRRAPSPVQHAQDAGAWDRMMTRDGTVVH